MLRGIGSTRPVPEGQKSSLSTEKLDSVGENGTVYTRSTGNAR